MKPTTLDAAPRCVYAAHAHFKETVHCMGGGIGFTDNLLFYVWASSETEANDLTTAYCLGSGIEVDRFLGTSKPARVELHRLTFPEQVIGLPKEELLMTMQQDPHSAIYSASQMREHSRRLKVLEAGRKQMAARKAA